MEDYKKKYEDALERAKVINPKTADYEVAVKIFPELKESEDEKIRKDIIKFFTGEVGFTTKEEAKKYVAWLEKQGEQKPEIKYIYPKFRVGDVIEPAKPNGHYVPVRVKYIDKGAYSCDSDDRTAFLSLPICNENDYVLTKQKPAEWSKEDEETFGYLEDIVNFCYRNQYVVNVQTCEKVRQLVFRLKSLCFQSGWGKDDITRINEIIETLNIVQANRVRTQRMHYNKATIDKNIDWLKCFRERMKNKQ